MGWFSRKSNYDRTRLLDQAMRAAQRRRHKRAIALYRKILAVDPNDTQIHRKIAPLLARTRQPDDAWESYRRAAEQLSKQGFVDQAIGTYREAATHLSRQHRLWLALAELEVKRGRPVDAVNALVDGSQAPALAAHEAGSDHPVAAGAQDPARRLRAELRARRRARQRRRAGPRQADPRGAGAARARPRAAPAARPPIRSLADAGGRMALARGGRRAGLSAAWRTIAAPPRSVSGS